MKILTVEEVDGLRPIGRGKFTWLYKRLAQIQIGEAIYIPFTDWKTKGTPYKTIRTAAKNLKRDFDYGRHPDGTAWLVVRER